MIKFSHLNNRVKELQFQGVISVWHLKLTFCKSWEPEYFAEMDFISPPNAEAHSFTLQTNSTNLPINRQLV